MNPIHTPTFVNSMLRIPGLEGAAACQHYLTIAMRNWELCGLRVFSFGTFDLRPSEIIGPSTYVPSLRVAFMGKKKIEKKPNTDLSLGRPKGLFCPRQNRLALYKVKDDIHKPFSPNAS